jgi:hypothetical protein
MAIRKSKPAKPTANASRNRDADEGEGQPSAPKKVATARLEAGGRLALPDWAVALMGLSDGSEVQLELSMDGLTVRPMAEGRDPEQWWFWTGSWQEGERDAEAELQGERRQVARSSAEFMQILSELEGGAR